MPVGCRAARFFSAGLHVCLAVLILALSSCSDQTAQSLAESPLFAVPPGQSGHGQEPIQPLPMRIELDERKVALGEALFHDTGLSRTRTMACATCHDLAQGGADGERWSAKANGKPTAFNTPTVFNSALSFRQNWDGSIRTLEEHLGRPSSHLTLLGMTWGTLVDEIRTHPAYLSAFEEIYETGVTKETVLNALTTFERSLITPNARFDRYLRGETHVLTALETKGYALFKAYGCVACHQGVNVGGNMFQPFGVVEQRDERPQERTSHENREHSSLHAMSFKVPSLRLSALTPPYFHDGSVETLEDAVLLMARYQLGRRMPSEDVNAIVAFLTTLVGEYRGTPLS